MFGLGLREKGEALLAGVAGLPAQMGWPVAADRAIRVLENRIAPEPVMRQRLPQVMAYRQEEGQVSDGLLRVLEALRPGAETKLTAETVGAMLARPDVRAAARAMSEQSQGKLSEYESAIAIIARSTMDARNPGEANLREAVMNLEPNGVRGITETGDTARVVLGSAPVGYAAMGGAGALGTLGVLAAIDYLNNGQRQDELPM
jgi:hypothetical protein